jgi:hypothetical protein
MMDYYDYGRWDVSYDPFYADKHYGAIAFEPLSTSISLQANWLSPGFNPPITLDDVKDSLRCEDAADDDLLTGLLTAAVAYVQDVTSTIFAASAVTSRYASFPQASQALSVTPEYTPGQSFTMPSEGGLTYPSEADNAIISMVLDDGDFGLAVVNNYVLLLPPAAGWPVDNYDTESPIGLTTVLDNTPPSNTSSATQQLLVAVKMLVGHWYANRESVSDARLAEVPMGVQMLLQNQTSHRGMF